MIEAYNTMPLFGRPGALLRSALLGAANFAVQIADIRFATTQSCRINVFRFAMTVAAEGFHHLAWMMRRPRHTAYCGFEKKDHERY